MPPKKDVVKGKGAVPEKDGSSTYGARIRAALRGRGFLFAMLAIGLLALALRLAVSADLIEHDVQTTRPSGLTDMWTYKDLSEQILKGEYIKEFYYQPFYYAVFLPVAKTVFGNSAWAVALTQALAGTGAILLAGLIAAMLWGRGAGLAAALLGCLSSALILYTPYSLIETSQSFWLTLLLYLTLRAYMKGGWLKWGSAGLILSFAILTRGNAWIFLPGILAACLWSELKIRRKGFAFAALCAAAILALCIAPQIPFAIRNTQATGHLSGPSTAAGAVLALGNTPEAPPGGRNPGTGPGPMEYPPTYGIWMNGEKERSVPARILAWAKSEPLAFLELSFRKALLYWDAKEIPNNIAVEYNGAKSKVWKAVGLIPTGVIIALALAGIIAGARRWLGRPATLLPVYFALACWAATVAFYILARFRVPSIPILCALAGGFVYLSLRTLSAREYRKALRWVLPPLALGAFFAYGAFELYRNNYEAAVMRLARPDGVRVESGENEFMILDNGPESFGGWREMKLERGMKLRKEFSLPKGDFNTAELGITSVWPAAGEVKVKVNGVEKTFTAKGEGPMHLDFELGPSKSYDIEVLKLEPDGAAFVVDVQRDYGRTLYEGKPLPCELVARLYLKKK